MQSPTVMFKQSLYNIYNTLVIRECKALNDFNAQPCSLIYIIIYYNMYCINCYLYICYYYLLYLNSTYDSIHLTSIVRMCTKHQKANTAMKYRTRRRIFYITHHNLCIFTVYLNHINILSQSYKHLCNLYANIE